ncbi:MAG: alpha/beta hydrolase family protein [Patescibacteria group bacterium]
MRKYLTLFSLIIVLSIFVLLGYVYSEKALLSRVEDSESNFDTMATIVDEATDAASPSPISIEYLKTLNISNNGLQIEEQVSTSASYNSYIASYQSDGNKLYGLLTIPNTEMPEGGYKAVVFVHGYIPPSQYKTTEKYVAYVDYLARNGFVVFKIDLRGHGESEGLATGTYFSNAYTIDTVNAVVALQKYEKVNAEQIGIWGHSMAGNLILRTMLVSDKIKAGVIWAGAVYSYEDFAKYRISDNSYVPRPPSQREKLEDSPSREDSSQIQDLRSNPEKIDFNDNFWSSISLTQNINYLQRPLQIHHAVNDSVVNIGYSRDLAKVLSANGKNYELYEYYGGGHNIESPYFETAMQRTVNFFKENL